MRINPNALKSWRERAGLSRHDLAEAVGVLVATISGYESGRINPGEAVFQRLLNALADRTGERRETVKAGLIEGAAADHLARLDRRAAETAADAWEEGRQARVGDEPASACPYKRPSDGPARVAWFRGYFGEDRP